MNKAESLCPEQGGIEDDPRFMQPPGECCDQLLPWLHITEQQEWHGGEAVFSLVAFFLGSCAGLSAALPESLTPLEGSNISL